MEVENVVGGGGCSVGEGCSGWRRQRRVQWVEEGVVLEKGVVGGGGCSVWRRG